ncbi:MAG: DUF2804 domain-containing protein [Lachnospiraceae bacterium]|nr:DUF2804 domain-containing protein [Lachnospiraceae bacterium]
MEHEVTAVQSLLDDYGRISEPGWARTPVWSYNRENIHAPWFRIKEWDYYLFNTDEFAVAFTISDLGYIGMLSVSYIDLVNATEHTESELVLFPKGRKFGLGAKVSDCYASCKTKRLDMTFERTKEGRRIRCDFKDFDKVARKDFKADLLVREPDMEAVYIATPWAEKETAFYYNCKMNCLTAEGSVEYGNIRKTLNKETCAGVLDWGRGVWTYDNTWFWGTGSGRLNGELFGFNLGYGFSDRSSASENGFLYKGKIHKLENVEFIIPKGPDGKREFMSEWNVDSADGRLKSVFRPIIDRSACMNFKFIISDQHQVFGRLSGTFVTDDGEILEFRDFVCALEVVRNKY